MSKLKLGVIFGGQSSEYSVSLHSAGSFLRQIHRERYELTMIGIDTRGQFYIYDGPIEKIEHDQWKENAVPCAWVHKGVMPLDGSNRAIVFDCVFPILHGKNGEDGCIQGLLELMNIHYVGCDVLSSSMIMDKEIMHILCRQANIPCADYVCLREDEPHPGFEELSAKLPLPWVIKPCNAGSSYGVQFVSEKEQYEDAIAEAWKYDGRGKLLVEEAVDGFEIGMAVMGNRELTTGKADEIRIHGHIFDFEGKYEMKGAEIICPAEIDEDTFKRAQELACRVYRTMNCTGMARVDMFVLPDKKVILNELNTIPGFTATSRYPTMMSEAGLEFPDLIDRLIDLAMEREVGVC
ncbi:D-alanine--D-alanine ligase family protein [Catenisphaera adipataccumulans]|uniref:D-alanine--D-alanine ligase n=1 Tax=Catenisphaera adipataccumulans TaxID=700500 RepID=A0A7W8CXP1_9FIRM|nr:D-alanine--D-alanine ligase family protein [Catenisphaera adipataccumulans]MBB5183471.1 D-alanine---D-serine ligase [Catenisphaera adipataccumulans]